jgi:hypothetical protein
MPAERLAFFLARSANENPQPCCPALYQGAPQPVKVIVGKEPARMSIGPERLNGIAANVGDTHKLKCRGHERFVWVFVHVSHYINFTFAAGTRASAAKRFKGDEAFAAIFPFHGQLVAYWLDIGRLHRRAICIGWESF